MEASLYLLDTFVRNSVVPKLIEKIVQADCNRVVLLCKDKDEMLLMDSLLWSYSSLSFLPHSTVEDEPVYLKNSKVVLTTTLSSFDSTFNILFSLVPIYEDIRLLDYQKVVFMYEKWQQEEIAMHIELLSSLSGISLRIFREENGVWKA